MAAVSWAGAARRGATQLVTLAVVLLAITPALAVTPPLSGPVIAGEWPDPEVVLDHATDRFVAYGTNFPLGNTWINVPIRSSGDLVDWSTFHFDALPALPAWAVRGHTWAPGVAHIGGRWVLYFTARHWASGRQCIGVAYSDRPDQAFTPTSSQPLVCQLDRGGSIDASPFQDASGQWWLHWKSDENAPGVQSPQPRIWAQPLTADGFGLLGAPTPVLGATHPAEGSLVEGPEMVLAGGRHVLFYGANRWDTSSYFGHWAVCDGPAGPCSKPASPADPWLGSASGIAGPGGPSLFTDHAGAWFVAFHGWIGAVGYRAGGNRAMFLERVTFDGPGGAPRLRPDLPATPTGPSALLTSGPTVVATAEGTRAFWRGEDRALWTAPADDSRGRVSLHGVLGGSPDAHAFGDRRIAVVVRGVDDRVWMQVFDGWSWGGWVLLGGATYHDPAVASPGGNRLDVVVTGTDGQLWHRSSPDAVHWSAWTPLGGHLTSAPDLTSWGPGRLDLVGRGADGQLWHRISAGGWSNWRPLGGHLLGGAAIAASQPGLLEIVARGTDEGIWLTRWNGRSWVPWGPLGGRTAADPEVLGTGGRVAVHVTGLDNRLWRIEQPAPTSSFTGWRQLP